MSLPQSEAPSALRPWFASFDAQKFLDESRARLHARWRIVAIAASVTAALAAAVTFTFVKPEVEAFFRLELPFAATGSDADQNVLSVSPLRLGDYKVLGLLLAQPGNIERFAASRRLDVGQEAQLRALQSDADRARAVKPVFSVTRKDMREAQVETDKNAAQLLGLTIQASDTSTQGARQKAAVLGDYIRDVAYYQRLTEFIRDRHRDLVRQKLQLDSKKLDLDYRRTVAEERLRSLRTVSQRHPEATRVENRSVLNITEATTRFLPLSTQLAAADISLTDFALESQQLERQRAQLEYNLAFHEQALSALSRVKDSAELIRTLEAIKRSLDEEWRPRWSDAVQISANSLALFLNHIDHGFNTRSGFLLPPEAVDRRGSAATRAAVLGALAGGLLAMAWIVLSPLLPWNRRPGDGHDDAMLDTAQTSASSLQTTASS